MANLPKIMLISKDQALNLADRSMDGTLMLRENGLYLSLDSDTKKFTAIAIEEGEFFLEEFTTIELAYVYLLNQYTDANLLRTIEKLSRNKVSELMKLNETVKV